MHRHEISCVECNEHTGPRGLFQFEHAQGPFRTHNSYFRFPFSTSQLTVNFWFYAD